MCEAEVAEGGVGGKVPRQVAHAGAAQGVAGQVQLRQPAGARARAREQHQLHEQASIWQAQEEASKEVSDGER